MDSKAFNIEQERLENTIQKINEREYYVSDLIDKKHSQIRQSINSTGDEVILNNRKHEMNILNSARKEPYFGRIDISSVEDGEETFYLGKQGIIDTEENIVVVDWRMPLASVFYNFTPGQPKQHYEVETDKRTYRYTVDVKQKREYKIENQKIEKINQYVADEKSKENKSFSKIGEELSVTDEFLRELIKKSETSGYLKEIIATIQKEQNIAIRKPLDQNVIIQGVAGSGKSSIALHRISYLLFNNKKLKPTDILILGPSRMFLSSFESILPNLEIKDIDQETFQDFAIKILNLNTKSLRSTNTFFERKVFNEISHETISFKGSREFINILDIFLEEYKNKFINTLSNLKIIDKFLMKDELIKFSMVIHICHFQKG